MAGNGWSHTNRDEQGSYIDSDSTDPHEVFLFGISFNYFQAPFGMG